MKKWIVTGISGSDRIELLQEIKKYSKDKLKKKVIIHDVGELIKNECKRIRNPLVDERILDVDRALLTCLRSSSLKDIKLLLQKHHQENHDDYTHFIGVHACFHWRNRIIPGISFQNLIDLEPSGFVHVHRNVKDIMEKNKRNPKWDIETLPNLEQTQEWMMEEEFITEVLAEVLDVPIYIVSRDHHIENLVDLFFSDKKRVYLSYPITAIQNENPQLLEKIQGPILQRLEKLFVVFNPLSIQDMPLISGNAKNKIPDLVEHLNANTKEIIKKRTIERDYQFIDQSDAVIVFYLTEKVSPGVLSEVYYAHRNMKPVYMVLSSQRSPFIEDAADFIEKDIDPLFLRLEKFASNK
jgi:adenylate kinase